MDCNTTDEQRKKGVRCRSFECKKCSEWIKMEGNNKLKKGMIVQLSPGKCKNKAFAGCFMVVTDPKNFGAQGYIQCTGTRAERGGVAYYRACWDEMELCGHAIWEVNHER